MLTRNVHIQPMCCMWTIRAIPTKLMYQESKENDAQEGTVDRNQQCASVVEEFRSLVETYIIEDENSGKFWAKELPSAVLNNACNHLDAMLSSHLFENIKSEYVFSCLDLFARVTIIWWRQTPREGRFAGELRRMVLITVK